MTQAPELPARVTPRDGERRLLGGVDVGGTKISAGVVTESGELREVATLATTPSDGAANLAAVTRLLDLLDEEGAGSFGLSLATTMDIEGRARDRHGYFGFTDRDLASELSSEARTVHVFHDAVSGAVAEYRHGTGSGSRHLLYVTVGTGLSHCLLVDGEPYMGAHHMSFLSGYTRAAACDRTTCAGLLVEDICAGPALASAYLPGTTDARAVTEASAHGDASAQAVLDHAAWHLGVYLADLVIVFDPDRVVIGGGVGHGDARYRDAAVAVANDVVREQGRPGVSLVGSRFGRMSCWLGAAELAAERAVDDTIAGLATAGGS